MIKHGDIIRIDVESSEPPHAYVGRFYSDDDEFVKLRLSTGEMKGRFALVPKRRITAIYFGTLEADDG